MPYSYLSLFWPSSSSQNSAYPTIYLGVQICNRQVDFSFLFFFLFPAAAIIIRKQKKVLFTNVFQIIWARKNRESNRFSLSCVICTALMAGSYIWTCIKFILSNHIIIMSDFSFLTKSMIDMNFMQKNMSTNYNLLPIHPCLIFFFFFLPEP